jgi:SPIRAL1-like protein
MVGLTPADVDGLLRPVLQKDLRTQLRARGLSPAGGMEALRERLKEHMLATNDFTFKTEDGNTIVMEAAVKADVAANNNYARPNGQNVDNFLTDRPSSRVLAVPGGKSSIVLQDASSIKPAVAVPQYMKPPVGSTSMPLSPARAESSAPAAVAAAPAPAVAKFNAQLESSTENKNNNYARPSGQNVGNFLTNRPSSRVLSVPGGASQISFG